MRVLVNVPETVVADALRGMAAAHPEPAGDEGIQVAKVLVAALARAAGE
ncbi:hypothetical protein J7I94_30440 [Streptomyces sp. ISL-12]|nr:hypothetical protein [Streptomyces sp. ISL-12]MBT2414816.1 hypothetical protein [Streptomyces sp. ISL-12]